MYNSEFFRPYVLMENNLHFSQVIKTEEVRTTDNTAKPQINLIPYAPLLFASICLIVSWRIAVVISRLSVRKSPQNGKLPINRFQEIPCCNCQFFQENHYLNCAVQPSVVLTKQALNCSDYLPNSSVNEPNSTDDHLR
ncbi:MAG: hypothetical protein PUP93_25005 [Rhizonema sp. NSF051]|nr:hypothetical protein [Rhizonema sp. NSF051]